MFLSYDYIFYSQSVMRLHINFMAIHTLPIIVYICLPFYLQPFNGVDP